MTKIDFMSKLTLRYPTFLTSENKQKSIRLQDIEDLINLYDEIAIGKLWDWFYNTYDKNQPPSRATFYNGAQLHGIRSEKPGSAAQVWYLFRCKCPSVKNASMKCGGLMPTNLYELPLSGSPLKHRCPVCGRSIIVLDLEYATFTDRKPDWQKLNRHMADHEPTGELKDNWVDESTRPLYQAQADHMEILSR